MFVLAGTGAPETYEPRFTYHGFRYVEVSGLPQAPSATSLEARVVHADLASTGAFASSDLLLNQIWNNNRRGIRNNSMSTPTDTPVRDERTPPGMDVQPYHDASTREFDPASATRPRDREGSPTASCGPAGSPPCDQAVLHPWRCQRFGVTTSAVQHWIHDGIVVGHRERYAQYNAWWLDIDDELARKLDRRGSTRRK